MEKRDYINRLDSYRDLLRSEEIKINPDHDKIMVYKERISYIERILSPDVTDTDSSGNVNASNNKDKSTVIVNSGIFVQGGSIQAEALAAGKHATATVYEGQDRKSQAEKKKNIKQEQPAPQRVDVAIITALPLELNAILEKTEGWQPVESIFNSIRTYYQYRTKNGLNIIATCAIGMGHVDAALVTADILYQWQPQKILLIGIAGGAGKDVNIGDVVVSDQVVDYELGKITTDGTSAHWKGYDVDAFLLNRLRGYRSSEWKLTLISDNFVPKVLFGVVLSGNKVVADEKKVTEFLGVWNKLVAIEMESAGVCKAISQNFSKPGFIMIKGVSDKADSKKDDKWQHYAAKAAWTYTISFLETLTPALFQNG